MRYALVMLITLAIGVTAALPAVSAPADGPSVCQYQDGTVLNIAGSPCPQQPFWTMEDQPQRGVVEAQTLSLTPY